jgi:hypothetical protein
MTTEHYSLVADAVAGLGGAIVAHYFTSPEDRFVARLGDGL